MPATQQLPHHLCSILHNSLQVELSPIPAGAISAVYARELQCRWERCGAEKKGQFCSYSFSLFGILRNKILKSRVKRQKPELTGFSLSFVAQCCADFPSCLFICKTRLLFSVYECINFTNNVIENYHSYNNNLLVSTTSRHFPSTKESKSVLLGIHFYMGFAPEDLYS